MTDELNEVIIIYLTIITCLVTDMYTLEKILPLRSCLTSLRVSVTASNYHISCNSLPTICSGSLASHAASQGNRKLIVFYEDFLHSAIIIHGVCPLLPVKFINSDDVEG